MNKILVTGNAGSGKSTLSRRIGDKLPIPVYSLDKVVWKPGWEKASDTEKRKGIEKLISKDKWIIDGVSSQVLEVADTVIFLDYPMMTCYSRVLKRNWRYLFRSRPELPENCPEILIIWELVKIIWNFDRKYKYNVIDQINKFKHSKKIIHISSNDELEKFMTSLLSTSL